MIWCHKNLSNSSVSNGFKCKFNGTQKKTFNLSKNLLTRYDFCELLRENCKLFGESLN